MKSLVHLMGSIASDEQIKEIPEGCRRAGLHAVARQFTKHLKICTEKKFDAKIKKAAISLIGNDTRILESRVEIIFDYVFRYRNDTDQGTPNEKLVFNLKQTDNRKKTKDLILAYKCFGWIGNYLRCRTMDLSQVTTQLKEHIKDFYSYLFEAVERTIVYKSVYLHVLKDDVVRFASWWATYFPKFNLGSFSSSTGEHKNKCIKQDVLRETNNGVDRMQVLTRNNLIRLFHFTKDLEKEVRRNLRCSKCLGAGHQKNNRDCPMHEQGGDSVAVEYFLFYDMTVKDNKYLFRQRGTDMFYVVDQDEQQPEDGEYSDSDSEEDDTDSGEE